MAEIKTWEAMRERSERLLIDRTGADLAEWNRRVLDSGIGTEPELRNWLSGQGVNGYGQMLVVMERFGYPDFLSASAEELIDGQYADRPDLRPILDRLLAAAGTLDGVEVQARKTYVTLVSTRRKFAHIRATTSRKFAHIRATTKSRIDLGLRLPGATPGGRLVSAKVLNDEVMTVRVPLTDPDEVDDEVLDLLRTAHTENS